MALLTGVVFFFCSRHYSYSTRDVGILERLMWFFPIIGAAMAFALTILPSVFVGVTSLFNR